MPVRDLNGNFELKSSYLLFVSLMELILNGNSEKGARAWNDLDDLICLRHLFRSRTVKKFRKALLFFICLYYHLIQVPCAP